MCLDVPKNDPDNTVYIKTKTARGVPLNPGNPGLRVTRVVPSGTHEIKRVFSYLYFQAEERERERERFNDSSWRSLIFCAGRPRKGLQLQHVCYVRARMEEQGRPTLGRRGLCVSHECWAPCGSVCERVTVCQGQRGGRAVRAERRVCMWHT